MRDYLEELQKVEAPDPVKTAQELSKRELPKRFYDQVEVGECAEGFTILLDGRRVKTPGRLALGVPSRVLCEKLAEEWAAQGSHIDPSRMPLTRMVNSALDGVAEQHGQVVASIAEYAGNDALCYRAHAPVELAAQETRVWDPLLQWAHGVLGVRFALGVGIMPLVQDERVVPAVEGLLESVDPLRLAALHTITGLTGSAVIALAAMHDAFPAGDLWDAAHLDEDWNIAQWGTDSEAEERRSYRREEFDAAIEILNLLRPSTA